MERLIRKRVALTLVFALAFTLVPFIPKSVASTAKESIEKNVADDPETTETPGTPTPTPQVGEMKLVKITKSSVEFESGGYKYGYGYIQWRKKGASTWNKKDISGVPKVSGLKADTTYQFQYFEKYQPSIDIVVWQSKVFTCSTASAKKPAIASIKITKGKNHKYGYNDIFGKWHTTGTAATGKITVTFKKKPKAKYAVISHSNGVRLVKIKGKKAVLSSAQFQRGSKKGGTTKVWVQTASATDKNTMQTGLSPKTKKYTVKIR